MNRSLCTALMIFAFLLCILMGIFREAGCREASLMNYISLPLARSNIRLPFQRARLLMASPLPLDDNESASISNMTFVKVLEMSDSAAKIKILDGPHEGKVVWINPADGNLK